MLLLCIFYVDYPILFTEFAGLKVTNLLYRTAKYAISSLAASWNVLRRMSEKMGNCQQILWCAVRGTVRGCGTSCPGIYEKTISVRDTFVQKHLKENFYHGLLLGILSFKGGWMVRSNRESGNGFSDIMIQIDDSDTGIIIEVKYSETNDLEAECRKALRQINDTGYT